jgi:outer membrane protein
VAKALLNGYNLPLRREEWSRRQRPGAGVLARENEPGEPMAKFPHYCAFMLLALLAGSAVAQPLKVGYVNVLRIENESALAKQAMEQLKKEFGAREQQLAEMQKQGNALAADLEKNAPTLPPAERQAREKRIAGMLQQYQQMQRAMAEDFEARKRESFAGFLAEVNTIIKNIAEAGKFDLILQQAVYNSAQMDITEQVLKEIAKRTAGGK